MTTVRGPQWSKMSLSSALFVILPTSVLNQSSSISCVSPRFLQSSSSKRLPFFGREEGEAGGTEMNAVCTFSAFPSAAAAAVCFAP